MIDLKGNRKLIVTLVELLIFAGLSSLVLLSESGEKVAIIGSLGGSLTAIAVPFTAGNYGENKAERQGNGQTGKTV